MAIKDATVSVKLEDIQNLQDSVKALTAEVGSLQEQLTNAKLDAGGDATRQFHAAFLDAMEIVRFAIGNLDPLTVRGWPYQRLAMIAAALKILPGIGGDQVDTANDLGHFARKCEEWEKARAQGVEQAKLHGENAARGPIVPT